MAGMIVGAVIIISFVGLFIYKRGWRQTSQRPTMTQRLWIAGLFTLSAAVNVWFDPNTFWLDSLLVGIALWAWGDVAFAWFKKENHSA